MVSGQNIAASVVLLVGIAGIFTWMKQNNHTTQTISLLDACNGALAEQMVNEETCNDIEQQGTTWETQFPCFHGFKEDKYFFTYKQGFDLMTDGQWGSGLMAAGQQCLELAKTDADWKAFSEGGEKFSVLVGRSEKRNLWGWRRRRRGPPPCTGHRARVETCKPEENWKGPSYRSCSIHLALAFVLGDNDYADCSGVVPVGGELPGGHYCWLGYYNGRPGYDRARNDGSTLARACIEHDACLSYGFDFAAGRVGANPPHRGRSPVGMNEGCGACDRRLAGSAGMCLLQNFWCKDNLIAATEVSVMVFGPNSGKPAQCGKWFEP